MMTSDILPDTVYDDVESVANIVEESVRASLANVTDDVISVVALTGSEKLK